MLNNIFATNSIEAEFITGDRRNVDIKSGIVDTEIKYDVRIFITRRRWDKDTGKGSIEFFMKPGFAPNVKDLVRLNNRTYEIQNIDKMFVNGYGYYYQCYGVEQ